MILLFKGPSPKLFMKLGFKESSLSRIDVKFTPVTGFGLAFGIVFFFFGRIGFAMTTDREPRDH